MQSEGEREEKNVGARGQAEARSLKAGTGD